MVGNIHPVPRSQQLSQFSALSGALAYPHPAHAHAGKENREPRGSTSYQVPIFITKPRPVQRSAVWDSGVTIKFKPTNPAMSGWTFTDIRAGRFGEFLKANQPVFWDTRNPGFDLLIYVRVLPSRNISCSRPDLSLQWPGYHHVPRTHRISLDRGGRLATKFDIARDVVAAFEQFLQVSVLESRGRVETQTLNGILQTARYSTFSDNADPFWRIGSSPNINDFVLLSISNEYGDPSTFQAVVEVVQRR